MVGRLRLSLDKDGSIAFDSTMTLRMTLQVAHHMLDCLAGNCVLDGGGRVFAFHPAHLIDFISLNTFHFISDPVLNHHFPRIIKNNIKHIKSVKMKRILLLCFIHGFKVGHQQPKILV